MSESSSELLKRIDSDYGFTTLAQSFAGLTSVPSCSLSLELGQPSLMVASSSVADITTLFPGLRSWNGGRYSEHGLAGGCSDEDKSTAMMKAIAEAAERYAMTVIKKGEYIIASANDLGDEAINYNLFPKCLDDEYELTDQVVKFDPNSKMRWITGLSLIDSKVKYVPLALTHITTASRRSELFTLPISTGVAVHTNLEEAISRAILEVVERDSISLTWLLQRELAKINFDIEIPESFKSRYKSFNDSHISQLLFDATTDLGIPVVYGVMSTPGHPTIANVVTAASDLDPFEACAKTMREAVSTRIALLSQPECPESPEQCFKLEHGAIYMGHPDREDRFEFLKNSNQSSNLSDMIIPGVNNASDKFNWLVDKLRHKRLETVIIDLTTDDLREKGLRAIRAVIPQLMPLSYYHPARFLDHPRLHQYASVLGIKNLTKDKINPYPQPFA